MILLYFISYYINTVMCRKNEEVIIAVVICGDRTSEALVMIKSAIVFRGNSDLRIVVVSEKKIQQEFDQTVSIVVIISIQ